MAKDSFWFTHDYNARNDDKILELRSEFGAEGYGIFWMIIETMADSDNGGVKATLIGGLSHGYGIPKATLKDILKFCIQVGLLYEENEFYFSKRILKHKTERQFFKEKGKEGSKKRWKTDNPPIPTPILKTEQDRTEQDNIYPLLEDVKRVFKQQGGTDEMAEFFFNKHSAVDWKANGQPIKTYSYLVPSFIYNWHEIKKTKNGANNRTGNTKPELSYDKP